MDDRWNPGKFSQAEDGNGLPNSTWTVSRREAQNVGYNFGATR